MLTAELIRRKRDGGELSADEISQLLFGIAGETIEIEHGDPRRKIRQHQGGAPLFPRMGGREAGHCLRERFEVLHVVMQRRDLQRAFGQRLKLHVLRRRRPRERQPAFGDFEGERGRLIVQQAGENRHAAATLR